MYMLNVDSRKSGDGDIVYMTTIEDSILRSYTYEGVTSNSGAVLLTKMMYT
jgi:hypothetical protein